MNKKYMDDRVAGACIPLVLFVALGLGQYKMAAMAGLLMLAGWLNGGKVNKKQSILWVMLSVCVCIVTFFHEDGETWAEVFLLYGSAAMLYQSLSEEGKSFTKACCLWIAAADAALSMIDRFAMTAGYLGAPEFGYLTNALGTPEAAGLFFVIAALSDDSPRRRYLFCVALGMTGSILGLIGLGAGLLIRKKDWAEDFVWTGIGLLFLVCPSNLWFLIMAFLFWCIPEMEMGIGDAPKKWCFIPLVIFVLNPWCLFMLLDWCMSILMMAAGYSWSDVLGTGAGSVMLTGGLHQTTFELGIITVFLLGACITVLQKRAAGIAWIINLIFGACAFLPATFLLGTGAGMTDGEEGHMVKGRIWFFIMLALSLYLCSRGNSLYMGH